MSISSIDRSLLPGRREIIAVGLLLLSLFIMAPLLRSGQAALTLAILAGLYFTVFSLRHLLPAALILVVLSEEGLGVFGSGGLPYVQVASGLRVTLRDALLLVILVVALISLRDRGEQPLFTPPLLCIAAATAFAFALGSLSDGSTAVPIQLLRPLFGFALYFIVVAAVNSRTELNWLVATIFLVVLASVVLQVGEQASGRSALSQDPLSLPPEGIRSVDVGGKVVASAWSRAPQLLFLALFLALGCLFEWQSIRLHAMVVVICLLGYIVALTRSWYIFIAIGTLTMLIAVRGWQARARFAAAVPIVAAAVGGGALYAGGVAGGHTGSPLLDQWLARSATLLAFQQESTFLIRLGALSWQWDHVLAAPLFGYGLSRVTNGLLNSDLGAINTLIIFGFVGSLGFVALIACALHASIDTWRRLPPSRERGYALGIVGAWAGLIVGYASDWDFVTNVNGPWFIVLALAIGDRLRASTRWPEQ